MTHVLGLRGSRQAGWESNRPDVVGATGEQSDQSALSRTRQALPCFIDFNLITWFLVLAFGDVQRCFL